MRRSELFVAVLVLGACGKSSGTQHADAAPAPFCSAKSGTALKLTLIAQDLTDPLFETAPPGDPRLFILQRSGQVRLIGADGILRDTPWFDIHDQVLAGNEQGMLGLAFHPDFAHTGKFYVDYTQQSDGAEIVAEYTVDPAAEKVTGATPRVLITQADPASNHNGGMLAFGLDGYLYWSLGDGGGGGDTYHNGQNQQALMAKIMRIDPDHPSATKPYGIPADNPWANGPGVPEMYVWGLRNPWRFSIDSETGDLYIGDVGQGKMEEVDVVPHGVNGRNYGWPIFEGTSCFGGAAACADATPYTMPDVAYDRTTSGQCAVIGGFVYRGTCMPDLVGTYFYSDYCSGEIDTFVYAGGQVTQATSRTADVDPDGVLKGKVSGFGTDGYNELYVNALQDGKVYRIEAE